MPIPIKCPCGMQGFAPDHCAGTELRCTTCGEFFIAPLPDVNRAAPEADLNHQACNDLKITVRCTSCGKGGKAPVAYAGRKIRCKACGSFFTPPLGSGTPLHPTRSGIKSMAEEEEIYTDVSIVSGHELDKSGVYQEGARESESTGKSDDGPYVASSQVNGPIGLVVGGFRSVFSEMVLFLNTKGGVLVAVSILLFFCAFIAYLRCDELDASSFRLNNSISMISGKFDTPQKADRTHVYVLVLIGCLFLLAGVVWAAISLAPKPMGRVKLRPCVDCGHLISFRAIDCPRCGGPNEAVCV